MAPPAQPPTPLASAVTTFGKDLACPICMSLFDGAVRTRCVHYFCEKCLQGSLAVKPRCPLCKETCRRREISADDTMRRLVQNYRKVLVATECRTTYWSQMPPPRTKA